MNKGINDIAMHRKNYTKPTMTVIPLKYRSHILNSSVQTLKGSKTQTDETWYELQ